MPEEKKLIYILYFISAALVATLAVLTAKYADKLYEKKYFSGAFIGVVLLAVITSLPEVFTSIAAITVFDMPRFPAGNVLGSNLFNMSIISFAIIFYYGKFKKCSLSRVYVHISVIVILMYVSAIGTFVGVLDKTVIHPTVGSFLFTGLYILGAVYSFFVSDRIVDEAALSYTSSAIKDITGKQALVRFAVYGVLLVLVSVAVTYTAGLITLELEIDKTFGGAIFLGITTSVPEIATFITLFQMKNFNMAVGTMIGSNMFNFTILTMTDTLYGKTVYRMGSIKIPELLLCGIFSTSFFLFMLLERKDRKKVNIIVPVLIILTYILFLMI